MRGGSGGVGGVLTTFHLPDRAIAIAAPMTAYQYDWNMLPIGQMIALRHLETVEDYPPMQAPPSYNLAQVMEQISLQKRSIHNWGHPERLRQG